MTEAADDKGHMGTPEVEREAIRDAKYAVLTSRASTEQAKQLVDDVFERMMQADRLRRMHAMTKQQIRRGVEGLLGDLLQAAGDEHAKGYVYRSLHGDSFTREDVGRIAFNQIIKRLTALSFLKQSRGYQSRFQWEPNSPAVVVGSRASRFRATAALLELAARFGVHPDNAKEHFIDALPKFPLERRAKSQRTEYGQKIRGRKLKVEGTLETERLVAEIRELNEFFDKFELRGGAHRGFIRIFNQGNDPEFKWNMGGRLYSRVGAEDNFQRLKEAERLQMTIAGEPVCEIDIKASYLTIYLALSGQEMDWSSDPYDFQGVPRSVVKSWFVATFGHHQHLKRWPPEIAKDYLEKTGRKIGKDFPLKALRKKAMDKFPVLATWGIRKNAWAELMYLESTAVVSAMLRLKREHSIPTLSVHDSLIVPASKRDIAEQVLTEEYSKVVKVKPKLDTLP